MFNFSSFSGLQNLSLVLRVSNTQYHARFNRSIAPLRGSSTKDNLIRSRAEKVLPDLSNSWFQFLRFLRDSSAIGSRSGGLLTILFSFVGCSSFSVSYVVLSGRNSIRWMVINSVRGCPVWPIHDFR